LITFFISVLVVSFNYLVVEFLMCGLVKFSLLCNCICVSFIWCHFQPYHLTLLKFIIVEVLVPAHVGYPEKETIKMGIIILYCHW